MRTSILSIIADPRALPRSLKRQLSHDKTKCGGRGGSGVVGGSGGGGSGLAAAIAAVAIAAIVPVAMVAMVVVVRPCGAAAVRCSGCCTTTEATVPVAEALSE